MFAQNDNLVEIEDAKFLLRNLRKDVLYDVSIYESCWVSAVRLSALRVSDIPRKSLPWRGRGTESSILFHTRFQVYTVPKDPGFTHVDFIWGTHAREVVWLRIIRNMINVDHVESAVTVHENDIASPLFGGFNHIK